MQRLPVIDVSALSPGGESDARRRAGEAIREACRAFGFFYAVGHGVAPELLARLDRESRAFFALPENEKAKIAMSRGGGAWRGWFPLGGELTSGRPDNKEGLYLGTNLPADDPRVIAGLPLHGANLYPEHPAGLRAAVEDYMAGAERAAQAILSGLALSLDLPGGYFIERYTRDPTVLFRVFRYPPSVPGDEAWGVGEHTDYGLLTLLATDDAPGLEVRTPDGWVAAPPVEGALICNIGDMLDRLTGGWLRSTPHRVRNLSGRERLSFPLFFDPAFDARIEPLPVPARDGVPRWDGADLMAFEGTYGDYLMAKVGRVFPDLGAEVL